MKQILYLLFAAALFSCNSQNNSTATSSDTTNTDTTNASAASNTDTGWVALFDGTSLNGWHIYGTNSPGMGWDIKDSAIHRSSSAKEKYHVTRNDDLVSDGEYGSFDLKFEWKADPSSEGANGGMMFHVKEDTTQFKDTYWTGPEMQVREAGKNDSPGEAVKHSAGDLYDLIASPTKADKPAGQWNQAEIICNGNKLDYYLNGVHTVSTTMWDDNWNKMVAASKFKQWPAFGTFKQGHFALQNELGDVYYKNIMLKKL